MESLERGLVLAKQVLSQLSYTPTVGVPFILKHLLRFQNPFPRIFAFCPILVRTWPCRPKRRLLRSARK
jgi:hypothetical protein